jgi:hypothetical protein
VTMRWAYHYRVEVFDAVGNRSPTPPEVVSLDALSMGGTP